jgi:hypothetical protein
MFEFQALTMGALNTGFDNVSLHRPTFAVSTITFLNESEKLCASCPRAFSPMTVNEVSVPSATPAATLVYLTTVVLMPPHRPLSVEIGTTTV